MYQFCSIKTAFSLRAFLSAYKHAVISCLLKKGLLDLISLFQLFSRFFVLQYRKIKFRCRVVYTPAAISISLFPFTPEPNTSDFVPFFPFCLSKYSVISHCDSSGQFLVLTLLDESAIFDRANCSLSLRTLHHLASVDQDLLVMLPSPPWFPGHHTLLILPALSISFVNSSTPTLINVSVP